MKRAFLVLVFALTSALPVHAGVDLWLGYGMGAYGERNLRLDQSNSHFMGGFSWSWAENGASLRIFRGSLERTDIPVHGDNDLDYYALDWLSGQRQLPVSIGFGLGRYQQAQAVRAPGGVQLRRFDRVWGPHFTIMRSWRMKSRWSSWAELDIHDVPLTPSIVVLTADLGLTWHIGR